MHNIGVDSVAIIGWVFFYLFSGRTVLDCCLWFYGTWTDWDLKAELWKLNCSCDIFFINQFETLRVHSFLVLRNSTRVIMEDGVLSPATMMGAPADSTMDLDFMDELFLDGCWLETTEGPGFPNQSPLSSGAIMDSSFFWPTSGTNGNFGMNPFQISNQAKHHCSMNSRKKLQPVCSLLTRIWQTLWGSLVNQKIL